MKKFIIVLMILFVFMMVIGCQSKNNSKNDLEDLEVSNTEDETKNKDDIGHSADPLVVIADTANNEVEEEEEIPAETNDSDNKELNDKVTKEKTKEDTKKDGKPDPSVERPKETPQVKTEPPAEKPKATAPVKTEPPAEKPKATAPVKTEPPAEKPKETPPVKTEPPAEKPKETSKPEEPSKPVKPSGRDSDMEKYLKTIPRMQIRKGPSYTTNNGEKLGTFNDYLLRLGKGSVSADSVKNSIKKMAWTERNYASSNSEDMWDYSVFKVNACRFETKNTDKAKIGAELTDKIWEDGSSYSGVYVYWDSAKSSYTIAAITITLNE